MKFFKRFLSNQNKNIEEINIEKGENLDNSKRKASQTYYSQAISIHQEGKDNFEALQKKRKSKFR